MHRTIIAILLISLMPISVDAQTPSPEVNWTSDWESEEMLQSCNWTHCHTISS